MSGHLRRRLWLPALLRPAAALPPPEPATLTRRRRVVAATLTAGVVLLAATLAVPADSTAFFALGFALAGVWVVGSVLSGPLHLGRSAATGRPARTVAGPILLGVVAYVVFLVLYLLLRDLPVMEGALDGILDRADAGPLALVVALALANAVAEEVFFRGALPEADGGPRAPVVATAVYVLTTVAGRNAALVAAAAVMGTVFMLERLATRGVLAPTLTHVTWSALMLLALPR